MEKSTIIFVAALAGAAGLAVLSYKRDAPQTTTTAAHEDPQPFDTNELPAGPSRDRQRGQRDGKRDG